MKRRAFLIGNSRGLRGVKKDIVNFQTFLMGRYGGAWKRSEIVTMMNPALSDLRQRINTIKEEGNDFVIVMFSGHGGYQRQTVLEINGNEKITESELFNLAPRQISIFDCCRVVEDYSAGLESLNESKLFSVNDSIDTIRQRYDERIMQALPQQNKLYACKIGQCAHDSDDGSGAYYLKNLIKYAKAITEPFGLVGHVHEDAADATSVEVLVNKGENQDPVATVLKVLTSQQLIISLKP